VTAARRVLVIGAGGVGSILSRGIAMTLEFRAPGSGLIIVDGDSYEPKNRERQMFTGMGNKAIVLASELAQTAEHTAIIPLPKWVVAETPEVEEELEEGETAQGKIAAIDLLDEGDVVFCVVDNFKARKDIFDAAKKFNNIDVFTGGNDDQLYGSIYHYQRKNGEEVTLHPSEMHPEYVNPPDRNPGELSCQERAEIEGGTQLLAVNMGVAAWLLARAHKTIFEEQEDSESEIYFDMAVGLSQPFDRRVDAPVDANV